MPSDRPAPLVHFLFRFVAFKLYFESGIAKWQSPLHDWQDGSAMTSYYETAPLPTWLAFYAHHLPVWWHHLESRATLVLELLVPFCIFGPRRARLFAAVAFTLFQLLNVATANYGFFCYLALALHLFLSTTASWNASGQSCRGARGERPRIDPVRGGAVAAPERPVGGPRGRRRLRRHFPGRRHAPVRRARTLVRMARPALELKERLRLVNTYHLFAAITRERIEPEFQTLARARPRRPLRRG